MKVAIVFGLVAWAALALAGDVKETKEYGREKSYGRENEAYGADKSYGEQKEHVYEEKTYEHKDKTYDAEDKSYGGNIEYKHGVAYNHRYTYHGKYNGHCGQDGFYYKNYDSFVICSNNNAYVQPCAPGSRNSALDFYNYGSDYYYRDFCDVNLVDHGYGAKGYYGYDAAAKGAYYGYDAVGKGYDGGYYGGKSDYYVPSSKFNYYGYYRGYERPHGRYSGSYYG